MYSATEEGFRSLYIRDRVWLVSGLGSNLYFTESKKGFSSGFRPWHKQENTPIKFDTHAIEILVMEEHFFKFGIWGAYVAIRLVPFVLGRT
jgi:hypothetical protein